MRILVFWGVYWDLPMKGSYALCRGFLRANLSVLQLTPWDPWCVQRQPETLDLFRGLPEIRYPFKSPLH